MVDVLPARLLRRHVRRRPDDVAVRERAVLGHQLGDAEIQDLPHLVRAHLREEEVPRLEIAVDDAGGARRVEADADLAQQREHTAQRHALVGAQIVGEIFAVEPLHRQEGEGRVGPRGAEQAHVVRTVEGSGDAGFAEEALHQIGLGEQLRVEELHGGLSASVAARLVDLAHRAAPDDLSEPKRADELAGVAADSAGAHRVREILTRLLEERVPQRERAQDHVVACDGLERLVAGRARDGIRAEEDELDEHDDDDLRERRQRIPAEEPQVGHRTDGDPQPQRRIRDQARDEHRLRRARVLAAAEEEQTERDDRRRRREHSVEVDA